MKQSHLFVFFTTCLVTASIATIVPSLALAQGGPVDSPPVVDPLLREVLDIPPSATETASQNTSLLNEERFSSELPEDSNPPISQTIQEIHSTVEEKVIAKEIQTKKDGEAVSRDTNVFPNERPFDADNIQSRNASTPSITSPNGESTFRKGRIGGWAGYVTGSDIEGGYTGRLELDYPMSDYPCFVSIRGEYLSIEEGDYTKTWKDVYGRYGYSYYSYTDKHTDVTDISYGGTALLLWNPIRNNLASVYGGIGFAYLKTKHDEDVSRVRVDRRSYGYHYWGNYSHRHYRTSRKMSSFHEHESDSLSSVVIRVGSSLCLWDSDILGVEVSYMPDLYDDGSECELRGNYLWKYSDSFSMDFFLEYRTETKILICGIGMSVWY